MSHSKYSAVVTIVCVCVGGGGGGGGLIMCWHGEVTCGQVDRVGGVQYLYLYMGTHKVHICLH